MSLFRAAAVGMTALALIGCQEMRLEDFSGREPRLDPYGYFDGRSRAWGIFEDRFGRLRREFTVDIVGRREGENGFVLEEDFLYADGETQRRVWRLRRTGPDTYEGTADDVIGVAQGRTNGNALNWRYVLALKVGESVWNVDFDDWMFLQRDGVMINRARVSKWGIAIGEVTLSFQRDADRRAQSGGDFAEAAQ
jgi:hypothetical protein